MTLAGPSVTTQVDLQASLDWIDTLHGSSPGLVHICAFGDWEGRSFHWNSELDFAARYIQEKDATQGIYLRVTTLRNPLQSGKRGSDTDSATFPGLWADIDLAGPGHKHQVCLDDCPKPHTHIAHPLPGDIEDAQAILTAAQLPEPTVWIHSGGGLYPMWLLARSHFITGDEDLEQLRTLSQTWQEVIAHGAQQLGFHYGTGVGDLSRVLRLPGTVNRKEGLARPCRILEDTWGRDYTLDELRDHLVAAVQQIPEPAAVPGPTFSPRTGDGLSPGDDYENRTSWAEILEPSGWTHHHRQGVTDYWTRPGKKRRDGHSASTGRSGDRDRLFVFSTDTDLPAWQPITKFHAYTLLNHRGDHKAAARELGAQGYGEQRPTVPKVDPQAVWDAANNWIQPTHVDWGNEFTKPLAPEVEGAQRAAVPAVSDRARGREDWTVTGTVNALVHRYGRHIRYVEEENTWRIWDSTMWARDDKGHRVMELYEVITDELADQADQLEQAEDPRAKALRRHVSRCRDSGRQTVKSLLASKVSVSAKIFDANPRYLNLLNGVYDMVDDIFLKHDPKYMLSMKANITFDPDETSDRVSAFFESLLPNAAVRDYFLRSLAYGLTGEADRKAFYVMQGLPNCGKTQIAEMMYEFLGGDGGYVAMISPYAFMHRKDSTALNPEIHEIRGKRMVFTSETPRDMILDEQLVKRLSGKDTMSTRTLHEKTIKWTPQATVFIATNNLPRLASDDEAIWKRVKTIMFREVFTDDGSSGNVAVPNIGRTLAAKESSGLFNLLLAALRRYRCDGRLAEPEEVKESIAEHRMQTDPIVRFAHEVQEISLLVPEAEAKASARDVYAGYARWCSENFITPLGPQRFGVALRTHLKYETARSNGISYYLGWKWQGHVEPHWVVGSSNKFTEMRE